MKKWTQKYPAYPDLTDGRLGSKEEIRERLRRLKNHDYGERWWETETGSELYSSDLKTYWADMLLDFVNHVDAGTSPEHWQMEEYRRAFLSALSGKVWEDSIVLPGRDFKAEWRAYSPREERDQKTCDNALTAMRFSGLGTTAAIKEAADRNHVSFETARAAFYKWRGWWAEISERARKDVADRSKNDGAT